MSKVQNVIVDSVRKVMEWAPARWLPGGTPDPLIHQRTLLGSNASRLDATVKVTGAARFAAEVSLDRLLYAAFVHSPITAGRITGLDSRAASEACGIALVMTYQNAPKLVTPALIGLSDPTAAGNNGLPVMQDAEIRFNGQVVAVVLGETQEQADHAASLVKVSYSAGLAQTRFEDAKASATTPDSILIERNRLLIGEAGAELKAAQHVVDHIYTTPRHNHNAIELHAATVVWQGDELTVHDAAQMINGTAATLAKVFGLKKGSVRVLSPFVGGAFGGKGGLWDHHILVVAAAKLVQRPVRLMLTREGVYRLVGGRTPSEQRVALGADAHGNLTAIVHTGYSVMPPYGACPEQYTFGTRHFYRSKSFDIVQHHVDLNIVANTFMRGPGESIGTFALESAIDELAHRMNMDPIELRRQNDPRQDPTSGAPFSQRALMRAYDDGAQRFGWAQRPRHPGMARDGEWRIGMGCASGTYPYLRMPGANVRITLSADGTAVASSAAHEMGMGTATVQTQHTADRLGLPLEAVRFELGDSSLPSSTMAGGSSQTASLSAGVAAAAEKLTVELLRMIGKGSPLSGMKPDQVVLVNQGMARRDDHTVHESYRSILERAGRDQVAVTGAGAPPLELLKFSMNSYSAIFCEVRVSDVTGEIRVSRLLGSFDCGRILNSKTAASQFRGGMIMGLGLALEEETLFDERTGRIMNASLADYHVPVHLDVPKIDVIWTDEPDPRAPLGARGIGEIGITGVAAAVANAVFNATGKRIRSLPITLDKVLQQTQE